MIRSWLEELLPEDQVTLQQTQGKLHVMVLVEKGPLPLLGLERQRFSTYQSKEDLINCLMVGPVDSKLT